MRLSWAAVLVLGSAVVALTPFPAAAQDRGAFIVRLGNDTTGVERFSVRDGRVELEQVTRAPRVMRRHASYTVSAEGTLTGAELTVSRVGAPAASPPVQQMTAKVAHDSIHVETRADTTVRRSAMAVPAGGTAPVASLWVMYDLLSRRLSRAGGDSLHIPLYFIGSQTLTWVAVRRLGRDSVDIETGYDRYHARVDRAGRLLSVRPIRGAQQFSVDRLAGIDIDSVAAAFAAREAAGGALGTLSPRDTARATIAGASIWIDYGRPSRRGRTIFGGVVPWGEVWRTGANAATQFKTDKALAFGSTIVPAGFYTLWTLPTPTGWTLIINGETGQWGTDHKPEKDLYRIPLLVEQNDQPVERFTIHIAEQGQIHFVWEKTVLTAEFQVRQ